MGYTFKKKTQKAGVEGGGKRLNREPHTVHKLLLYVSSATPHPRSWKLRTQKLKSHLVGTQSLNVLPFKPEVGQYIAIHATLTARDFSSLLISALPVRSPAFFPKHLPIFFCVGCG